MKTLTVFLTSLLLLGCQSIRVDLIKELKGAGCAIQSLNFAVDTLNIRCMAFSKDMYFMEYKKNHPEIMLEIIGANEKPQGPSY